MKETTELRSMDGRVYARIIHNDGYTSAYLFNRRGEVCGCLSEIGIGDMLALTHNNKTVAATIAQPNGRVFNAHSTEGNQQRDVLSQFMRGE